MLFKVLLTAARPKTLPAAIVPVTMAGALAFYEQVDYKPSLLLFCLILLCATLIQVLTNYINDLADFLSGADTAERKGPLRVTASGLATPEQMKFAIGIVASICVVLGIYLSWIGGWPILLVGLVSLTLAWAYSAGPLKLSSLGLADIAVLLFFGPIPTAGTYYLLTGHFTALSVAIGVSPGLISTAILVVNNFRDVEQDRRSDKRTWTVRFGVGFSKYQYSIMVIGSAILPVLLHALGVSFPDKSLLVSLTLPVSILLAFQLYKTDAFALETGPKANRLLAQTGGLLLFHGTLFVLGLVLN